MENKLIRFLTCGSVDDGKSTLIGRLLYDTDSIYEDQIDSLKIESKKYGTQGKNVDYALLMDGLLSERAQGITIDVAYKYFDTKKRKFIIADTPGHEQYTRNMATAASNSEVTIILIDAKKGISLQTKRHLYISTLFGVTNIIVAVNKMDILDYSKNVFEDIKKEFISIIDSLDLKLSLKFIPISALNGDNIVQKSINMDWYKQDSLLDILENIDTKKQSTPKNSFIFPVQYVNRPNENFRAYLGTILDGKVNIGDKIKVLPSNNVSSVKEIIYSSKYVNNASIDDAISLVLNDEIDISRGDIVTLKDNNIEVTNNFKADIIWMDTQPLVQNNSYELKLSHINTNARVIIESVKDMRTFSDNESHSVNINEIANCKLNLDKSIPVTLFEQNRQLGSFILIDKISNNTVATGVIKKIQKEHNNIFNQKHTINKVLRSKNLNQKPFILWFTGLSSSGKSTIANEIEKLLFDKGFKTYLLDGDNLRGGLNSDLGFSSEDREENIRRVAHLSQIVLDSGLIVISAFISPFIKDREFARSLVTKDEFIEIYLDIPIETCEQRDTKGLYKKAKEGIIKDFTGVNSPYEVPQTPQIVLKDQSIEESVNQIIEYLYKNSYI